MIDAMQRLACFWYCFLLRTTHFPTSAELLNWDAARRVALVAPKTLPGTPVRNGDKTHSQAISDIRCGCIMRPLLRQIQRFTDVYLGDDLVQV
jgi:hypothetical protein